MLADVDAAMCEQRITHGLRRYHAAMILTDTTQRLGTKNLFEERFVFEQAVEVLRRPKFPEHVAAGTESFATVLEGFVHHSAKHVHHLLRFEFAVHEMALVGRQNQGAYLHFAGGIDSMGSQRGIYHPDEFRAADVKATPV